MDERQAARFSRDYEHVVIDTQARPNRDGEEAHAMLEEAIFPLFGVGIRRIVAFQRAALNGVVANEVDDPRAAHGWEDYLAVGKEIAA